MTDQTRDRWAGLREYVEAGGDRRGLVYLKAKEVVALLDERDQAVALLRAWSHWWDDRLPTHAVYAPVPETRAFLAALSDEENRGDG